MSFLSGEIHKSVRLMKNPDVIKLCCTEAEIDLVLLMVNKTH